MRSLDVPGMHGHQDELRGISSAIVSGITVRGGMGLPPPGFFHTDEGREFVGCSGASKKIPRDRRRSIRKRDQRCHALARTRTPGMMSAWFAATLRDGIALAAAGGFATLPQAQWPPASGATCLG